MTLGSVIVGIVIGYGIHKVAGEHLDKGIDPALAMAKEQIMVGLKQAQAKITERKIAAAEPVNATVIEMG